ncbi:unnamed protein product [Porites lobata]|uniref:Uncharacterized protein n=1 Tax=Porites lobata TaxID=104759 RepID=A0ABN8PF61_9CNID|nr:unnamed protein product [Porites lobata]
METSDHKAFLKRLTSNATARNMIDLLLVITILVLLRTAAPIIRGECDGWNVDEKDRDHNSKCNIQASCMKLENSSSVKCICHVGIKENPNGITGTVECDPGNNNSFPVHKSDV